MFPVSENLRIATVIGQPAAQAARRYIALRWLEGRFEIEGSAAFQGGGEFFDREHRFEFG